MSTKIRKRNGRAQKFRKKKLIRSLQEAGLETHKAKVVASMVNVEDGMSTGELKFKVYDIVKKMDGKAAEKYWTTRVFKVNEEAFEANGSAIISEETMDELELNVGDPIDIYNGERFETVRAYEVSISGVNPGEIYISHNDMEDIGIHSGNRIAVRKHVGVA